jgi:hypothetical protein
MPVIKEEPMHPSLFKGKGSRKYITKITEIKKWVVKKHRAPARSYITYWHPVHKTKKSLIDVKRIYDPSLDSQHSKTRTASSAEGEAEAEKVAAATAAAATATAAAAAAATATATATATAAAAAAATAAAAAAATATATATATAVATTATTTATTATATATAAADDVDLMGLTEVFKNKSLYLIDMYIPRCSHQWNACDKKIQFLNALAEATDTSAHDSIRQQIESPEEKDEFTTAFAVCWKNRNCSIPNNVEASRLQLPDIPEDYDHWELCEHKRQLVESLVLSLDLQLHDDIRKKLCDYREKNRFSIAYVSAVMSSRFTY